MSHVHGALTGERELHRQRVSQGCALLRHVPGVQVIGAAGAESDPAAGTLTVVDPATGDALARVPDNGVGDAVAALAAAADAGKRWAAQSPQRRSDVLLAAYHTVLDACDEVACLIAAESGKTHADAVAEVRYGAGFLRWYAELATHSAGRHAVAPDGSEFVVQQRPVGLCVAVCPWNFPLAMITRKVAPALAAGCSVVLKPSELTPLTAYWLQEVLRQSGLPDSVVEVVTTAEPGPVVDALLGDSRARKLTFTGSTAVGTLLAETAARQALRVSLELGGNAPFVVCKDADLEDAVAGAVVAKYRNAGQACTAANRFIVHEAVAAEFVERFVAESARLQCGYPLAQGTQLGPLASITHRDKVVGWVQAAEDLGGTVHAPVRRDGELPELLVPPTVVTGLPADAPVLAEEIFGPVAPVLTFSDNTTGAQLAGDTQAGLVAYVYTRSLAESRWWVDTLEVGMVGVNTGLVSTPAAPFGGAKLSGIGREGGPEGLTEYTEWRYVKYP